MVLNKAQQGDIINLVKNTREELFDEEWLEVFANKIISKLVEKLDGKFNMLQTKIVELEDKLMESNKENVLLKLDLDDLRQGALKKNLRVYGLPEDNVSSCKEAVKSLISDKLGVKISMDNIAEARRIGDITEGKIRPVFVKFSTELVRNSVFKVKKSLKGTGIVVREDLTKLRLETLNKAKDVFGKNNVWSDFGSIKVFANGSVRKIRSESELAPLVDGPGA